MLNKKIVIYSILIILLIGIASAGIISSIDYKESTTIKNTNEYKITENKYIEIKQSKTIEKKVYDLEIKKASSKDKNKITLQKVAGDILKNNKQTTTTTSTTTTTKDTKPITTTTLKEKEKETFIY